jgi:virulence-associated protein VagC
MTEVYKIENVEALWPRIDQTYVFNEKARKSMPCGARDQGAEYSIEFRMGKDIAQKLHKEMFDSYAQNRQDNWEAELAKPKEVFVKEDDGRYKYKSNIKGQYKGRLTQVLQVDSKGNRLPSDFKLTTGSTVNIYVEFVPYKMGANCGVSLRLKAVQVVKYYEYSAPIEFDIVEGGYTMDGEDDTLVIPPVNETTDSFDEETVEEPKKAAKKTAPPPTAATDDDLSSIVEDWDD